MTYGTREVQPLELDLALEAGEAIRVGRAAVTASHTPGHTVFPEAYRRIKAANVGLLQPGEVEARELEAGKNECALGGS